MSAAIKIKMGHSITAQLLFRPPKKKVNDAIDGTLTQQSQKKSRRQKYEGSDDYKIQNLENNN